MKEAHWRHNANGFYSAGKEMIRSLNPEISNLYCTTRREVAWVSWTASLTLCKQGGGFGYDLLDGESCYLFYRRNGNSFLTKITAYTDQTFQIDAESDRFFFDGGSGGTLCKSGALHFAEGSGAGND